MSTDSSSLPFPPIHFFLLLLVLITFITLIFTKNTTDYSSLPFPPIHLCFILLLLFTFIGFPGYMNYESSFMFEGLYDQIKLVLIFSPLILLVVVHLVSRFGDSRSPFFLSSPERAGGTPWAVGFLLVFLFFVISYNSSLQERWSPLLSRS